MKQSLRFLLRFLLDFPDEQRAAAIDAGQAEGLKRSDIVAAIDALVAQFIVLQILTAGDGYNDVARWRRDVSRRQARITIQSVIDTILEDPAIVVAEIQEKIALLDAIIDARTAEAPFVTAEIARLAALGETGDEASAGEAAILIVLGFGQHFAQSQVDTLTRARARLQSELDSAEAEVL